MKISFITIHIGSNFGSNLQAIATSEVLKDLGADPICVNYIPPRTTYERYWKEAFQSLRKIIKRICYFPFLVIEKRRFANFLAKNCKVSRPIYAKDNFVKVCPKADIYLTGSDQVWNFTHNEGLDTHYFFDGIEGKKISFSASIGKEILSDEEFGLIAKYTKDYKDIAVREGSAVKLFRRMGRKVVHLLDPTLMLNCAQWRNYATQRLVKEPYLFVYLPYNIVNKELCYQSIRKIANTKNLKIVTYSCSIIKERMSDKTIYFADPGDFLSLMLHAEYVITNSFHGTAFSINLNKQFWVYMPLHFSTRITSVIALCNLETRILVGLIQDAQIDTVIDYIPVNKLLEVERKKGYDYLRKALAD